MKRIIIYSYIIFLMLNSDLFSTPSTHIWSPSADIQPYKVFHLTSDFYVPVQSNNDGSWSAPIINFGLTVGILPYSKLQAEIGVDHIAGYGQVDSYPFYFNAKVGTPEGSIKEWQPAFVVGGMLLGQRLI